MRSVYRVLIALALLLVALMFYSAGSMAGGIIFLLLGIAFEGGFWLTLFGRKRSKQV